MATFSISDCDPCPARSLCTSSSKKRRQLTVLPRNLAEAQAAARAAETAIPFQADYARRAGVRAPCTRPPATAPAAPADRGLPKTRPTTRAWPARST